MEHEQANHFESSNRSGIGTLPLVIALFCVGAVAVGLFVWDRDQSSSFETERVKMATEMNQAVNQSKSQIQDLNSRIDTLTAALARSQAARPAPSAPRTATNTSVSGRKARRGPVVANDPRVDRLQGQLTDTQQELAKTREELSGRINSTRDDLNNSITQTRDDVAKTRDELAKSHDELSGRLNSTRDDLNGSIAKTHDEVVALRKRGEQNIYEFRLDKSKQFERVGPLSVSLRSTNPKHKTYDLAMMVEDAQLSKKHVNLYEPIWIRLSDRPQAVELVVNHVDKDRIAGYISEPKYKKSELASTVEKAPERPQQLETR